MQYRDCYERAEFLLFLQIYLVKLFVLAISEPSNISLNLYMTEAGAGNIPITCGTIINVRDSLTCYKYRKFYNELPTSSINLIL